MDELFDEELEELLDELFDDESELELDEEFEDEFEDVFELELDEEFELEFDELLPATTIAPSGRLVLATSGRSSRSSAAGVRACATPAPSAAIPMAAADVIIHLLLMSVAPSRSGLLPFLRTEQGRDYSTGKGGGRIPQPALRVAARALALDYASIAAGAGTVISADDNSGAHEPPTTIAGANILVRLSEGKAPSRCPGAPS